MLTGQKETTRPRRSQRKRPGFHSSLAFELPIVPYLPGLHPLLAPLPRWPNSNLQRLYFPIQLHLPEPNPSPNNPVRHPLPPHPLLYGISSAHHLRRGDLQIQSQLVHVHARPTLHARLLQPPHHLAQTPLTMAFLPPLVPARRHRSPRERRPLHVGQLQRPRLLARLAPLLQPLDRPLHLHTAGRLGARRRRRKAVSHSRHRQHARGVHLRRAVARHQSPAADVGVAHHAVRPPRGAGGDGVSCAKVEGSAGRVSCYLRCGRRLQYSHDDGGESGGVCAGDRWPEGVDRGDCRELARGAVHAGELWGFVRGCAGHV